MYAVIAEVNGTLAWYGAYEDRDYVDNLAKALGGKVVILYHPFQKKSETGDNYGREM